MKTNVYNIILSNKTKYKVIVSIVFGIFGFFLNMLDISFFSDESFKISLLVGMLFPLFISFTWGWKFSVITFFSGPFESLIILWKNDGWGILYSVTIFGLWIICHGVWRNLNQAKSLKYNSHFLLEIVFRFFSEFGFFTIFPYLVSFNPPFWNANITWSTVSSNWINSIVFKHIIIGFSYIIIIYVITSFKIVKKFFFIKKTIFQNQISKIYLIGIAIFIFYIIFESIIFFYLFNQKNIQFIDVMFLNVPPILVFSRILVFILVNLGMIVITKLVNSIEKLNLDLMKKIELIKEEKQNKIKIFNAIPDEITIIDTNYNVIYSNSKKIKGNNIKCYELLRNNKNICSNCLMKDVYENNLSIHIEKKVDNKWFDFIGIPLNTKIEGKNVIFEWARDITNKKAYEKHFHQNQKLESIGIFANSIAHDFKNILQPILFYIDNISSISNNKEIISNISEIHKTILRAKDIANQLLSFCKNKETNKTEFNLSKELQNIEKMMQTFIKTTIDFKTNFSFSENIYMNKSNLNQILMNLIINSEHAVEEKFDNIKEGRILVMINEIDKSATNINYLDFNKYNKYLHISVSDNGMGIKSKDKNNIFTPFYTTKDKNIGSGMGLSVIHGIVKSYNGYIDFDSIYKIGTKFNIYLPVFNN